jgi:hypothetical protein
VEFAVVEEDLPIMILGKQACEDAKVRRELQLFPFGLAPGGGKTKQQKEDESQRKKGKAEEAQKRREEQAQAQATAEQQKRAIENSKLAMADQPKPVMFINKEDMAINSADLDRNRRHMFNDPHSTMSRVKARSISPTL